MGDGYHLTIFGTYETRMAHLPPVEDIGVWDFILFFIFLGDQGLSQPAAPFQANRSLARHDMVKVGCSDCEEQQYCEFHDMTVNVGGQLAIQ